VLDPLSEKCSGKTGASGGKKQQQQNISLNARAKPHEAARHNQSAVMHLQK